MKPTRLVVITLLVMVLLSCTTALRAADINDSESTIYIENIGFYRYFHDERLKDSSFELYFAIDSCTEMTEFIRCSYDWQSKEQGFGYLVCSSSTGSMKLPLGNSYTIEKRLGSGGWEYSGRYNDAIFDIYDSLELMDILLGDDVKIHIEDKKGNTLSLSTDIEAIRAVINEYRKHRDSFSKIW